jgi:hypothetical protein
VRHRPEWFDNLGRLCLDVLRRAMEPATSRQVAAALMGLARLDAGGAYALTVVEHRVRASLTHLVGIVERVSLGTLRKGWRVADPGRDAGSRELPGRACIACRLRLETGGASPRVR